MQKDDTGFVSIGLVFSELEGKNSLTPLGELILQNRFFNDASDPTGISS